MGDASASWVAPRFFRILLQRDIDEDQHMLIPKEYTMEHCYGLSKKVTLELPNGDTWLVELVRDGKGRVWFKKGWQQFSRHYRFQHGHFLLFELQGDSRFAVFVFDRSAAEIDYSSFTVDSSCPEEQAPALGRMKKGDPKDDAETQLRPSSSKLPNDSSAAASAANVSNKRPFFSKVIKKGYSSSYTGPNFPLDFVRKYITKSSKVCLRLRVGDKEWLVKLLAYDHHGYSLPCGGWWKFATDNLLEKGDICTFEVTTTITTLDVHIQRAQS